MMNSDKGVLLRGLSIKKTNTNSLSLLIGIKQTLLNGVQFVLYAFLLFQLTLTPFSHAGPLGGNITSGTGNISQSNLTTTIRQNTSSLAIDWNSFNIHSNEVVNFIQPGSSSIVLNRILSNSSSQIHGQINANGQVVLVNPNGIFFGETSSINVGGLIASGLDISTTDFMNGNYIFNEVSGTDGFVINSGLVNASLGGSVALLGKQVRNEGVISAQLGSISLASGKAAILTFDQQGLLGVQVTEAVLQEELGIDAAVLNSGEINAEGGRVLLTASISQDVFSKAVNSGDLEQATSVVVHDDGAFTLGTGADIVNTGSIDVSTTSSNQNAGQIVVLGENVTSSGTIKAEAENANGGEIELHATNATILDKHSLTSVSSGSSDAGSIKVLGGKVGLFDASTVSASGYLNGGEVLIGGDFQGNNINIRNSSISYIGEDVNIYANSEYSGDGGKVIQWADSTARFYGSVQAQGGSQHGDGGFVEISGKGYLDFSGDVNLNSEYGQTGTLLLDPQNITITNGGNDIISANDAFTENTNSNVTFDADLITNILTGNGISIANVELQATADIWVREAIDISGATGNTQSLTLRAGDDIEIDADILLRGGTLTLSQGDAACATGCRETNNPSGVIDDSDGYVLDINAAISTVGGDIVLGSTGDADRLIKIGDPADPVNISTGNGVVGDITFNNTVMDDGVNPVLNIEAGTGNVTFNDVAGTAADYLAELNISSANIVNLDAVNTGDKIEISANTINLNDDVRSDRDANAGDISLTGNVFINSNLLIDSSRGTDGKITITGSINDDADVGNVYRTLDLTSDSKDITITQGVGGTTTLQLFRILSANNVSVKEINTRDGGVNITASTIIDLGGDILTNTGTNGGIVDLNGAVTLSADVSINTSTAGTDGSVDFSSTLDTDAIEATTALHTLSIDAGTSTVAINGALGGIDRLLGLSITNASDITLSAINVGSSGLTANGVTLNLGGDIDTDTGIVDLDSVNDLQLNSSIATAGGDVFIDVTDITSGYFRNDANDGSSISSGTGNIAITTAGNDGSRGVRLGAITTTGAGALSVTTTNGSIVQSTDADRDLDIGGVSNFDAGTDSITLSNNSNDFIGSVSVTASSNVLVNDSNSLVLGTLNITGSGNLEVTALNGGISQFVGSTLLVNGMTTFTSSNGDIITNNSGNDFVGVVNIDNTGGNAVTVRDNNNYTIGSSSLTGGTYTVNADTDINLPTSLSVNSSASSLVLNAGNDINITANPLTGSGSLALTFDSDADASTVGEINLNTALIESGDSDITFNGDTVLLISSTVDSGTSKVDFMGVLDATTARNESLDITAGDVDFDGAVGAVRLGDIIITATGAVNAGANSITANSLDVTQSDSFISGAIDTVGAADNNGGSVTISALDAGGLHEITITDIVTSGGAASGVGLNGGIVSLFGSDITIDSIISTGSNGVSGGAGGVITVTASDNAGTQSITINNNLNSLGGLDSTGLVRGVSPDVVLTLSNTGTPGGTVNLRNTVNPFSSNIIINGSSGSDTLSAADKTNTWIVSDAGSGGLNSNITFNSFENITGGSGNDSFTFTTNTAFIDGLIDAGTGVDDITLFSGGGSGTTVQLAGISNQTGNGILELNSFETIAADPANSPGNILLGTDADTNWFINGAGSGSVGGIALTVTPVEGVTIFSNFNTLNGGTGADTFTVVSNNLTAALMTINGGVSADPTEYDTLTGPDIATIWTVDSQNGGTLVDTSPATNLNIQFSNIENLRAGSRDDTFAFLNNFDVDGFVDGGLHTIGDTIDLSSLAVVTFNVSDGLSGRINFESVNGNWDGLASTGDSTIIGANSSGTNDWQITGDNSGSVGGLIFTNFNNLTGGTGTDTFTFTDAGEIDGLIDGNGGTTDQIILTAKQSAVTIQESINNNQNDNNILEILNIDQIDANAFFTNEIRANNLIENDWIIDADLSGTLNASLRFDGFSILTGADNVVDNFSIASTSLPSQLIFNGGASIDSTEYDTLNGSAVASIWTLNGINSGSLVDNDLVASVNVLFDGIENLTASDATDDIFNLAVGGVLSGNLTGGTGTGIDEIVNQLSAETDWTITGNNQGSVGAVASFTGIENLTGSNTFKDTFNLQAGGISGTVSGGTSNTDEIINQLVTASTWNITGAGQGDVEGVVNFININNLTGADAFDDTFNLAAGGSVSGIVNGGASGNDTLVSELTADTSWNITGDSQGDLTGINNFSGIENLTGADNVVDTFSLAIGSIIQGTITGGTGTVNDEIVNAADTTSTWNITGGDQGDLTGIVFAFTGIESLTGSNIATDIFNIQANGALSGILAGGTGAAGDSIVNLTGVATDWNIIGLNAGNVTAVINAFTGIENLTGADNVNDVFYLAQSGSITGTVNGGSGSGNDEIISQRTTDTVWNITGADTGNVNGITQFADIENLTGNIQNDTFKYTNNASSISGIVKGNLLTGQTDADTVDMSNMTTTVLDVVLGTDFIDIEKFIGNSTTDLNTGSTFTAGNTNNDWHIFNVNDPASTTLTANQGTVIDTGNNSVEVTFENFYNITGGSQVDNFLIESNGKILGAINGGDGDDNIDFSNQTGVIDKTVGATTTGSATLVSIQGIIGNGTQSILRVSDGQDGAWTIDGINSGTVTSGSDTTSFIGFNILQGGDGDDIFTVTETGAIGDQAATDLVSRINGGAGNDSLTITLTGGDAKINLFAADGVVSNDGNLTFSSAFGSNDFIQINGALANFDTAIYSVDYASAQATHSYNSATSAASVSYTGVEAVNDFVQAANLIISGAGGNNIVDINGNGAGAGTFDVATTNTALPVIDWATVNYQNKTSLSVRDLGVAGIINIMSNLEVDTTTGYFDFEAAQIVNAGGYTLTGNELRLDSVLVNIDSANPLLTDINKLQVTNSSADIYVLETNGINLEQADTTGFLSIVSSNGDIVDSDTQGLVSSGDLSLNAMAGSIVLDNVANNLTGTVSLATGTGGSATLSNSASISSTTLGASNVGAGTLTVISTNAEIVSTDTLVASAAVLDAGNNAINLTNVNNDFDSLTVVNAASLDVSDVDDLELANVTFGSGILNIKATGITQQLGTAITQTADIFLGTAGTVTIDSATGGINLSNAANDFIGDVSLINSGSSDVLISDVNNIQFANTTIGSGLFTVSANSGITQTAAITQQTGAAGATFNAGAGVILLADTGNDFTSTVSLFNTGNNAVDLTDSNSVELGLSDVGGSFDIVALNGGDITQSAALSVAGNASFTVDQGHIIKLDNASNNFQQGVSFFAGGGGQLLDVLISNNRALNLADINVSRHLAVVANGDVTNSGILNVGGVTWIEATGNTVSLNNTSNNFNDIVINAATASISDVGDINIGTADSSPYAFSADSTITNNLTLSSLSGNITDTAGTVLSVGDTATFSAGDIILDEVTNNFNKVNIISAQNVSLVDVDAIDIQSTVINGDLNIIAGNGITNDNGSLNVLGASHFTAGSNENITIDHAGNQLNGSLTFDALSGNLSNVSMVNTVATDIQGLTLNNTLSVVSGAAITQGGGFNVDTAILSAINSSLVTQDILLDDINNISNLSIGNANNVTLNNAANALIINELNATGVVNIISGNLLSVNAVTGTDITLNSASGFANLQGGISASGTMSITANGIVLDGIVESVGDTLLDAQTGDVSLSNTITVSTGDLTIKGDNILQGGDITAQAGSINLTSASNYSMNADINAGQNITLVSQAGTTIMGGAAAATATNGSIQYSAEGNVNVALLSALNGTVAVSSNSGQIIDSNGTAANFKSITLELDAVTGIGNNNALETEVAIMDIHNTTSGDIKLQQTGSVEFVALHNIQSNGLVDVRSNGDFIFNPGSVVVSRDQGTIFMSTSSGSFLGKGLFNLQNADITANVATFFALSGTFGTTVRPLVLDVPVSGSVLIDSRTSSIRFYPQTPDDLVTTGIDIGALGVVSAVAGEQLVEIESLGDIDPAIFTDLQNYSKAETSIRMPRDQLFEDELEEENQQI